MPPTVTRRKYRSRSRPGTRWEYSEVPTHSIPWTTFFARVFRAFTFIFIAALCSPVSQASLAPVFGAIPAAANHNPLLLLSAALGFLLRVWFKTTSQDLVARILVPWSFWIPVLQDLLFAFSDPLGPVRGAGVVGFFTCYSVAVLASYAAAEAVEGLELGRGVHPYIALALPGIVGVGLLNVLENILSALYPELTVYFPWVTPVNMQLAIGVAVACETPTRLLWLAAPAMLYNAMLNKHMDTGLGFRMLNNTLAHHNWTILDRSWSRSGYVSVLESFDGTRVMRCDHSLLGGEFQLTPDRRKEGWEVPEPVFACFTMLEAARLVVTEPAIVDANAKALVIGLGVGTLPKAFIDHGIDTTIIELDTVVHAFATEYFDLPPSHNIIIEDAREWVETATRIYDANSRYDYIIHDVFTGGAEPLSLFTDKFVSNLKSLLKPHGVIALNYAGQIHAPLTRRVLATIQLVFDDRCVFYRDTLDPEANKTLSEMPAYDDLTDFANIVAFCRKSEGPIQFRRPVPEDFLKSRQRWNNLLPTAEQVVAPPLSRDADWQLMYRYALLDGDEVHYAQHQLQSALRHWHLMRMGFPAAVWELW